MKNTILLITAMALACAPLQSQAGDKEWSVVGKVLTGIFAIKILDDVVSKPKVVHQEVVVVQEPPVYHTPVTVVEHVHHTPTVVVEHHYTYPRRQRVVYHHAPSCSVPRYTRRSYSHVHVYGH